MNVSPLMPATVRLGWICCLLFAFPLMALHAADLQPSARESFEVLVKQWQDLKCQQQKELAAWQEEKGQLQHVLLSLGGESGQLQKQLSALKIEQQGAGDENGSLVKKMIDHEVLLTALRKNLLQSGRALQLLIAQQPDFVKKKLQQDAGKLGELLHNNLEDGLFPAYANIFSLLSALQDILQKFHVREEILDFGQGSRQMARVLYFGTTCALALSTDGHDALQGVHGKHGWTWRPIAQKADIREAIAIVQGECPAALVHLPLPMADMKAGSAP